MNRLYANPKYWITAILLSVLRQFHRFFPYHFKLRVLKVLGRIAYRVLRTRRNIATVNLSLCFPTMSIADRDAMVRRNFEHFFVSFLEIAISWWGKDEGMLDNVTFISLLLGPNT